MDRRLWGKKKVHKKLTIFNQNNTKFQSLYSNKSTKFTLHLIIFLVNNHLHILEWDHQLCQKKFMRNTMMPIMTFLAPSFPFGWIGLQESFISSGRKVKGWDPFHFSSFIGWKASSCVTGRDAWQRKRQTRCCTSRLSPNSDSLKHNSFAPNPSHHKIFLGSKHINCAHDS